MQSNTMIRKMAIRKIFITDGTANAAKLAYRNKLCLPGVVTTEALLGCFAKGGPLSGIPRAATTLQIVEVVLVQHHAVVFKTEAAIQLRIFSELFLIDLGSFDEVGNLFVQF